MSEDTIEYGSQLKSAFDKLLQYKYGNCIAPPPVVTPFNIRHLDAVLGGGLSSSSPVVFSSTPETGKSTLAFQFASIFQKIHRNSVVMYLDVEGASNIENSIYFENRIQTFNIDESRFSYCPNVMDLQQVFTSIDEMIKLKYGYEEKVKSKNKDFEMRVLIIWDSIAATPSSKDIKSEDVNETIGFKARELTFLINKYKQSLMMNKINFLIIDQVRSNIKITNPYAVKDEASVGDFNNFKSATNVSALHHAVKQWLYLSKGTRLSPNDSLGIDGYEMNVQLEKNKLAPSGVSVPLIFDKKYGVHPLFSEYIFLSKMTKTEIKLTGKNESKLPYPLVVFSDGRSKIIKVIDPINNTVIKESGKFTERKLQEKYNTEDEFKKTFDLAMKFSIEERIIKASKSSVSEED